MDVATTNRNSTRWVFLGVISLGLFMIGVDNSILYTALPTLKTSLHTTSLEALWIINMYPLVLSGLLLGTGTLGDKIGHRRMFEIGLSIFGVAALVAAFAPNPEILIAARALFGIGAATMMPATLSLLRTTFTDVQERNTAIGIWGATATLGAASGPVIGGFLLEHFWWGSVFLINLPVVIIAVIGTTTIAPPNTPNPEQQWDFLSSFWAMVAMMGLVMIIKEATHSPIDLGIIGGAAAALIGGGWLFARRQRFLTKPLLVLTVFQNKVFTAGVLSAGFAMFALSGTELLTTQRFQLGEGFTPLAAGLVTAAGAVAAIPTSVLGGIMLSRIGFRPLISGGFAIIAAGAGLCMWAIGNDSLGLFIGSLIAAGAGAGLAMSVSSTAIIGSAHPRYSGMASAMEEVSYEFGTLLSVAVLGSLMQLFYSWFAPAQVADSFESGLANPQLFDAAYAAFNSGFTLVMLVVAAVSATVAGITAWLLHNNPKETDYAHE